MTSTSSSATAGTGSSPVKVAILYKRFMPLDEQLVRMLEEKLSAEGFAVFTDKQLSIGVEWAKALEDQLSHAHAVIPLLSAGSSQSEMLAYELELAHEAAERTGGRPRILPVRVNFNGTLPELLARILDPLQYFLWESPLDNERLVKDLAGALRNLPAPQPPEPQTSRLRIAPRPAGNRRGPIRIVPAMLQQPPEPVGPEALEPLGGAVPLWSKFYVQRPQDAEMRTAIQRLDSIILIKGARQMGKTSLLARGLQHGRERGAKVVLTDFQKLNVSDLESPMNLYFTLAESLAEQLDLAARPEDSWDERRGPNINFERYLRREVLGQLNAPLIWGLDEVDRLFTCKFGSEVFGLFRSWHNERALDPGGPWVGLTLAIAYATEAHLFITDMNQSPFNVGTRLALEDFTRDQVAELNRRYGAPLKTEAELDRLIKLVAGHPFLVRRALHELATQNLGLGGLEEQADRDEGMFGDHLRRMLVLLARDPALADVVRGVLRGGPCPNQETFYRLRSAGVMIGISPEDVRPRCELYAKYLSRHLL